MSQYNNRNNLEINHPDRISSYFKKEIIPLLLVMVSGLIYNFGLTAGPYFEGQLAQKLFDIIEGESTFNEMVNLTIIYVIVILIVQTTRCMKRFYVRRFANNTSRNMRHMLYNHLVHQSKNELNKETVGTLMTKTVADVDTCAEGMRKFTTEVFDTGIALIAYIGMMLIYDWKLTLIACIFTPVAYIIAEKVKIYVYKYNSEYKKAASALNDATMERVSGAMTYRVTSLEDNRDKDYENHLMRYEKTAVMANILENTLPQIYNIISMTGVLFIIYYGGKNVLGSGFCQWDISAFTAFMSCFAKMAIKSSKASKLFNSVQKAQVSWKRIKPLMQEYKISKENNEDIVSYNIKLEINNLSITYTDTKQSDSSNITVNQVFSGLTLKAKSGDIIGVTGPVACGKTSFGKVFLGEFPYEGEIIINDKELREYTDYERNSQISYLGHQPELMSDTIEHNISYGDCKDIMEYLKIVCFEQEINNMPSGVKTVVGAGGTRLSGGQQARLALARTLYNGRKILILDDPFSAVDSNTERIIMDNLKKRFPNVIIIILSHRITMFADYDYVIWMNYGKVNVGTHEIMMNEEPDYAQIYNMQQAGGDLDEE